MEQALLIEVLTRGMEKAKQLRAHMGLDVSSTTEGMLIEGILLTYENALSILNGVRSMEQSQQHVMASNNMPSSPLSAIESPKSEDIHQGFDTQQHQSRYLSKKRKAMPTWTEQVTVRSENSLEGPPDDGYSWRKYGQKDILGAKYPRSYYRCTYRDIQSCCAIKQVQRADEDPMVLNITYKGNHSCTLGSRSKHTSPSEKKEQKTEHNIVLTDHKQQLNATPNFQTGLNIDIQRIENQQLGFENHTLIPSVLDSFYSSFTPSFEPSPTTSESNYFSTSPCNMSNFGGFVKQSESDITDIISATTSVTNSPIIGIDFPLDRMEFNLSFPFDDLAFSPRFSQFKDEPSF